MASPALQLTVERLVEEHYQLLYRFAYRLSGSAAEAEDLTQETFCQAQGKLHQLRDAGKARSWLCAILRNVFLHRRRHERRESPLPLDALGDVPEKLSDEPFEIDSEQLQEALNEMPETYRTPVILYFFEEFSYRDIAEQLGAPIGTVMSRLARGKAFLRERLGASPALGRKEEA
jgi:RNA polymerase sigma-70 factor (ECF subfamily)